MISCVLLYLCDHVFSFALGHHVDAHFDEHAEPQNVQELHAHKECELDPDDRLEVDQVLGESHLGDNCVDAHGQNRQSRICPRCDHEDVAEHSGDVPVEPVAEAAEVCGYVGDVVQPGHKDTDSHQVRKDEARVERQRTDVVQGHLTPVVVDLLEEEVPEEVLHVVPVCEENVAVNARRRLLKHHGGHEAPLDGGVGVQAPDEARQPERLLHHAPPPERRDTEID